MSVSNSTPPFEDEHRRKRVRKGTKSCWECKRRKIKCQLSTESVPVCSGCLQRGTTCISQEYPEEYEQPSGAQMGERLGRVEMLLEKLLEKVCQYEKEKISLPTPESTTNDVLTPFSGSGATGFDSAPILSLFDNVVIGRRDNANTQSPRQPLPTPPSHAHSIPSCRPPSKLERLRMTVAAQLPCQQDSDLICHASNCWLLIHALSQTSTSELFTSNNTVTSFHLAEVAKQHPTMVTRTLLYIAVCMQQLPNSFDKKKLQIIDIDEAMDKYMSTASLVTSDDELVSTIEGLECLVLQGVFHINAGNLRRSWLTFRRAINAGQLMGLHKGYTQTLFSKGSEKTPSGKRLWHQISQADRYLALLLGMPCGAADDELTPEETFQNPNVDVDQLFNRKMCNLSGRIIERNHDDHIHAFAKTQSIDESLENLAKEMPASYWIVPKGLVNDHSVQSAQQFDRIMSQIWFFQLQSLLHLPFMLRASTERRYEYSRFACLRASREMLTRYLALRMSMKQSFCCKVVDFGAFTATITLLLAILEPSHTSQSPAELEQKCSDRTLVDTVLQSMEELSFTGDVVARQSVVVIKTLSAMDDISGTNSGNSNLRLTIPYFGTVNIFRAPPSSATKNAQASVSISRQPLAIGQDVGFQDWQALPFAPSINQPFVSFQSSQFPPFVPDPPIEDWNLQESDNLFFDSLLNTDIEGNWIF